MLRFELQADDLACVSQHSRRCTAFATQAKVQPGQQVLIVGAAGGVGTFAVQIAKWLGAEVTGVCSTGNVELVRSLGADHVVDYTKEDYARGAARYDLILDNVGDHSLSEARRALKPDGVLLPNSGRSGMGYVIAAFLVAPFAKQQGKPYLSVPNRRGHGVARRARRDRDDGEAGRGCHIPLRRDARRARARGRRTRRGQDGGDAVTAAELWEAFLGSDMVDGGAAAGASYTAWCFGTGGEMADELAALVMAGGETRDCGCAVVLLELEGDPLPQPGEYSVILDGADEARCIIRTDSVDVVPSSRSA